tara:strand:- start:675 stop:1019 length:345 start_codon:yes stop_codon:yes gene_type:complete
MKMMHKPALEKQRAVTYTDKGEMEMITQLDKVYNEVENWATVHHPNIIKLYEIIDDDKHDYMYVILELANMGQIAKWNADNEQYERNQGIVDTIWEYLGLAHQRVTGEEVNEIE